MDFQLARFLAPIKREMDEREKEGKKAVALLMSPLSFEELKNSFRSDHHFFLGSGEIKILYGMRIYVIEGIEGHFFQVLCEDEYDSKYNDWYPKLEQRVRAADSGEL